MQYRGTGWPRCWLLLLVSAVLTLGVVGASATSGNLELPPGLAATGSSTSIPVFNLPSIDGKSVQSTDLEGKVAVVLFWATWWPICRGEMPSVQRVYDELKDKDVVVLTISIDGDGEKSVKPYMAENGFTFPALIDPRMEVARKFGVRGVPTTYVVNRKGAIVAFGFGPGVDFQSPEFVQYIQTLLAQPHS